MVETPPNLASVAVTAGEIAKYQRVLSLKKQARAKREMAEEMKRGKTKDPTIYCLVYISLKSGR